MNDQPSKVWYQSRTVWANVISTLVAIILLLSTSPLFAGYAEALLLIQGVLNIVLRAVTDEALRLKP